MRKRKPTIRSSAGEYLSFIASSGGDESSVEMRYEDENIWLTAAMISALLDVDEKTVSDDLSTPSGSSPMF